MKHYISSSRLGSPAGGFQQPLKRQPGGSLGFWLAGEPLVAELMYTNLSQHALHTKALQSGLCYRRPLDFPLCIATIVHRRLDQKLHLIQIVTVLYSLRSIHEVTSGRCYWQLWHGLGVDLAGLVH